MTDVQQWYKDLEKSRLTPPPIVFGYVWPFLHILFSLSFTIYAIQTPGWLRAWVTRFFIIQSILVWLWPILFFREKSICFTFALTLLMFFFVFVMMAKIYETSLLAFYLLLPYLAWIIFASYLNAVICHEN